MAVDRDWIDYAGVFFSAAAFIFSIGGIFVALSKSRKDETDVLRNDLNTTKNDVMLLKNNYEHTRAKVDEDSHKLDEYKKDTESSMRNFSMLLLKWFDKNNEDD